ncbi:hypothetical protein RHMOL_Rhmol08G0223300 [Rhododendron molle]|uniref:Uncharacterized protein n=1 Tax=Rhododendron molle TaxID=49168 RepID=A0ACC0MTA2_RHOML|nr:hypothetical protein RHMOL_Rhmol08G0223300 [Rhododendron molle]
MSGLKINFSKSSLCGVNVPHQDVISLAQIMGCKTEALPIKYLGLPLGANPRRIKTWDPILEKMEKRLNVWRRRINSSGGRLTLINSSFSHLPTYFMSIFKMPLAVANAMEKLQRQFFWGDTADKKKLHLVKWETIAKKKEFGGLGVRRMMQQNLALLSRWWWRFNKDKNSLWVKVIRGKYYVSLEAWLPYLPRAGHVTNIWRDICSLGDPHSSFGSILIEGLRIQVNYGKDTSFWNDIWLGDRTLKEAFPRLFLVSSQKEDMVSTVKGDAGDEHWNLSFRKTLRVRENQLLDDLLQRLQSVILDQSKEDVLQWKWSTDKQFTVKSIYNQWEQVDQNRNQVLGSLWKNLCPPKVEIFSWLAVQEKVATRSALSRRNMIQEDQQLSCPLCSMQLETPSHLLLFCQFSWSVWSLILDWWHVVWVCPSSLAELALWWFDNRFGTSEEKLWKASFYATLWSLWLVRNDYVFNNATTSIEEVGELVKTRVAMWMKSKFEIKFYSVEDFRLFLDGVRKLKF